MPDTTSIQSPSNASVAAEQDSDTLVEDEMLVEEISIDGMCGVY